MKSLIITGSIVIGMAILLGIQYLISNYTENGKIRKTLRKKGIPSYIAFPRLITRFLAIKDQRVHWCLPEEVGFIFMNIETMKMYNTARIKNKLKKLRERDLNKQCVCRFPRKVGFWQKKNYWQKKKKS